MQLRDYQQAAIDGVRDAVRSGHKRIIVHLATGAGKGLIMAHLACSCTDKGGKSITIMRMRDLVFQTVGNYKDYYDIDAGVIMATSTVLQGVGVANAPVVASIDTLISRIEAMENSYALVIVDEIQDTTSEGYQRVLGKLSSNPKTIFVGFSATPYRIGKKGHSWWDIYVCPAKPSELRDQGYLVPVKCYGPKEQIDTERVSTTGGEYNQKELEHEASSRHLIGGVVDNYEKYAAGKPFVVFAVTVAHSKTICTEFARRGYAVHHIDASTPTDTRNDVIQMAKNGKIQGICNVGLLTRGIDIPSLGVLILATATKSLVKYLQIVGRVLRPHKGKDHAIILDHGGNCLRHGDPYEYREPELTDKQKGEKPKNLQSVRQCPECFYICSVNALVCPECSYKLRADQKPTHSKDTLEEVKFSRYVDVKHATMGDFVSKNGNECTKIEYVAENKSYFEYFTKSHQFYGASIATRSAQIGAFLSGEKPLRIKIAKEVKWWRVKRVENKKA